MFQHFPCFEAVHSQLTHPQEQHTRAHHDSDDGEEGLEVERRRCAGVRQQAEEGERGGDRDREDAPQPRADLEVQTRADVGEGDQQADPPQALQQPGLVGIGPL